MKKIFFTLLATTSMIFAVENVQIQEGWQLVGSSNCISNMDAFDKSSVKTVWAYDKSTNRWKAFFTDDYYKNLVQNSESVDLLDKLEAHEGFWVNANSDDTLIFTTDTNASFADQNSSETLNSLPLYNITQEQKDGLSFMYQEEKMARDVYTNMYEKWGMKVFLNISQAEQTHMNSVKALLEKYELAIPLVTDNVGEFELDTLQELYDQLLLKAKTSSTDALEVGVLVEETDIADLISRMVDIPDDIKVVYDSLLSGSYKHLDAFNKQLN